MPFPHVEWRRHVFVVSDATGDTCEMVAKAALSQFAGTDVVLERVPQVRTEAQVLETMQQAARVRGVVVYTMVSMDLRHKVLHAGLAMGVPTVDILGPILTRLSEYLELSPIAQPGLFRHLDREYFKRLEAVDFTVQHDDGLGAETLQQAEIVLVGVSRTSKTPVSLYLSFRGWKVANLPIVMGLDLPRQLFEIDARRIVGFTVDPMHLHELRMMRQTHLRARHLGAYTEPDEIKKEVRHALRLFQSMDWPVLNVTSKAIEETSTEVMQTVFARAGIKKGPFWQE